MFSINFTDSIFAFEEGENGRGVAIVDKELGIGYHFCNTGYENRYALSNVEGVSVGPEFYVPEEIMVYLKAFITAKSVVDTEMPHREYKVECLMFSGAVKKCETIEADSKEDAVVLFCSKYNIPLEVLSGNGDFIKIFVN